MVGAFSGSFSISMTYVCKRRPSGVFSLSSLYFMPYSDGFATYHINYHPWIIGYSLQTSLLHVHVSLREMNSDRSSRIDKDTTALHRWCLPNRCQSMQGWVRQQRTKATATANKILQMMCAAWMIKTMKATMRMWSYRWRMTWKTVRPQLIPS